MLGSRPAPRPPKGRLILGPAAEPGAPWLSALTLAPMAEWAAHRPGLHGRGVVPTGHPAAPGARPPLVGSHVCVSARPLLLTVIGAVGAVGCLCSFDATDAGQSAAGAAPAVERLAAVPGLSTGAVAAPALTWDPQACLQTRPTLAPVENQSSRP